MPYKPLPPDIHRLLKRQLKRHLGITETVPDELMPLLAAVNDAYRDYDCDLRRLDRALEISSQELFQANIELRGILKAMPDWLFRIGADGILADLRQNSAKPDHYLLPDLRNEPPQGEAGGVARLFWDAIDRVRQTKITAIFEFDQEQDGHYSHYEARLVPFLDRDIIGMVRDITVQKRALSERKDAEERVHWQAYHDALTGLPNRIQFQEQLEIAIGEAQETGGKLAVLFLDLDRFKNVNDTLGHAVGDDLLKRVSERLQTCLCPEMLLSRMGGDEFTVLIPRMSHPDEATAVARCLLSNFEQPFTLFDREVFVAGSVGVSIYPEAGLDCQSLLQHADIAMYTAKGSGCGAIRHYVRSMDSRIEDRVTMEAALRRALERDELILHYQPQVESQSRRIVAVEALVRWNHPDLGLLSPGRFIPLAEETGLILRLGEWVLNEACRQAREWERQGQPIKVAVNVFARQFEQASLNETIARILRETGLCPSLLDLELTESVLIRNWDLVSSTLQALRQKGIRVALDDFGTGYSSLSYIRRLPIDMLKIDRSFVEELAGEATTNDACDCQTCLRLVTDGAQCESTEAKIIRAVIDVSHALNLVAIAEGVETEHQRSILENLGCDQMQGFLFSRPLPVPQLESLLRDGAADCQRAA